MQTYRQTFQFEAENDAAAIRIAKRHEDVLILNRQDKAGILHVVSLTKAEISYVEVDLETQS